MHAVDGLEEGMFEALPLHPRSFHGEVKVEVEKEDAEMCAIFAPPLGFYPLGRTGRSHK
jgi:hypothetical protein